MTTARDIIKKAAQKGGIITKNDDMSADEMNDGLGNLNNMIASWGNDSLLLFYRTLENFYLEAGKQEYTIGSGGDFDTIRPISVLQAFVSQNDIKLSNMILCSDVVFQQFLQNLVATGIPTYMNYNNNYPLGKLRFYVTPGNAYKFTMLSEKALSEFDTLDTNVDLPPGWDRMLINNLAIEMLPEYGQEPSGTLVNLARESKNLVKTGIAKNTTADFKPMGTYGKFNIYRGW